MISCDATRRNGNEARREEPVVSWLRSTLRLRLAYHPDNAADAGDRAAAIRHTHHMHRVVHTRVTTRLRL